jgi:hypothetical protein
VHVAVGQLRCKPLLLGFCCIAVPELQGLALLLATVVSCCCCQLLTLALLMLHEGTSPSLQDNGTGSSSSSTMGMISVM